MTRITPFYLAAAAMLLTLGPGGCAYKKTFNYVEASRSLRITDQTVATRPLLMVPNGVVGARGTEAGTMGAENGGGNGGANGTVHAQLLRAGVSGDARAAVESLAAAPGGSSASTPASASATRTVPIRIRGQASARPVAFVDAPVSLLTYKSPAYGKALPETRLFAQVMQASAAAASEGEYQAPTKVTAEDAFEFAGVTLDVLDRAATLGGVLDEPQLAAAESFWGRTTAVRPAPAVPTGTSAAAAATVPFDLVAKTYLQAYFKGKFVNRRGVKLAKPKIEGNKVDNATIAALETVLIEAYFDFHLRNHAAVLFQNKKEFVPKHLEFPRDPFYVDGYEHKDVPQYFTEENAEPTATTFVGVQELVVPPTEDSANPGPAPAGVTDDEYEVIRLFAGLTGEAKKQITKLVFQIFGGVEFSLVFGGHFEIGNNETLATMIATFIEVASARTMEFKLTQFFREFRYHFRKDPDDNSKLTFYLTPADRAANKAAPLKLNDSVQDGVILLIRHHKLIARLIGD